MSLETDALDAASLAATNQTIAANSLKDAIDILTTAYATTKSTVDNNLNNVDNTSDADKPISTSALTEFLTYVKTSNLATVNGQPLNTGQALVIARGQVEVPVLDYANRDSLRTPVLPVPLTGDVVNIAHLGHFQYITSFEYVDDDEMVFESVDPADGVTPIGQWVLSLPAYEFTEAQKMFENAVLFEWMEDEQLRFNTY
jgi:hypothetical protein